MFPLKLPEKTFKSTCQIDLLLNQIKTLINDISTRQAQKTCKSIVQYDLRIESTKSLINDNYTKKWTKDVLMG